MTSGSMEADVSGRVEWDIQENGDVWLTTHNGVTGVTVIFTAGEFGLLVAHLDIVGRTARHAAGRLWVANA